MMILPCYSAAQIQEGICQIDRKFHTGACLYAERLPVDIVVIAPELRPSDRMMDFVSLPVGDLPYRLETVRCDGSFHLDPSEHSRVEALVENSTCVYGMGFETQRFAHQHGKPYIPILEYNLKTQIQAARLSVPSAIHRAARTLRTLWRFLSEVRDVRRAYAIHCNGYPVFEQTRYLHRDRLIYLDSRMFEDMVISSEHLEARLSTLGTRRPRLIYSGRFDAMKGALDVVDVGLELRRLGVDFELDLYGQGEQREQMGKRVGEQSAGDIIRIHEPVPYPELVEISRTCDVFICCHVQDDPSCSYLEAFGSGLAVVGYSNRMWRSLSKDAASGVVTPMGDAVDCARAISGLLAEPDRIRRDSRRAREFALDHCFEREFSKRIEALETHLDFAKSTQTSRAENQQNRRRNV